MIDSSPPSVIFNDISTNSGPAAGELFPVVHIKIQTFSCYYTRLILCTNIYSNIWKGHVFCNTSICSRAGNRRSQSSRIGYFGGEPVSKNFTLDASPIFAVTIATTSPFDLSASNIVIITIISKYIPQGL
jgi:hypothetical protein